MKGFQKNIIMPKAWVRKYNWRFFFSETFSSISQLAASILFESPTPKKKNDFNSLGIFLLKKSRRSGIKVTQYSEGPFLT